MGRRNRKTDKQKTKIPPNETVKESNDKTNVNKTESEPIKTESNQADNKILQETNGITVQQPIRQHETNNVVLLLTELKLTKNHINSTTNSNFSSETTKHRDFYMHHLCQVCKNNIDKDECCKKCQMISYCSADHRRKHWPIHADICEAIQDLCTATNRKHILESISENIDADVFRNYCYNLMSECKIKIQRNLEEWEIELFLFPKTCDTCYNWNINELTNCMECQHTNYCKDNPEHLRKNHRNHCSSLVLYRKILQHQWKNGCIKTYFPETYLNEEKSLENKSIGDVLKLSKNKLDELEFIQLTEIATGPLTAANAITLSQRKNTTIRDSLTIHIIGAEKHFELSLLKKWEIFFTHFFITLKTLNIVFIGPEINLQDEEIEQLKDIKLCDNCVKRNIKINFEFYDKMFYHDYRAKFNKIKPDLICAFNAGLYRKTGFNEDDTWPQTIKAMFKSKNTPVLVTAYTSIEMLKDIKRITEMQKCEILKMPSQNPFSSLKPNLNFVSYEDTPVIFKNYYFILLTN